jgi:dephospho-CoA kinase
MKKKIIGLVGGIGSGKSSVADAFECLGCASINADRMAHKILEEENIRLELKKIYGDTIFDDKGAVIKSKLAETAFADKASLEKLNNLIHPRVISEIELLIEYYQAQDSVKAIVLDIPLLMEVGWEKRCDFIVFVACDLEKRQERAAQRGEFFKKQLEMRENFQISLDKKAKIADYTINNNSDLISLKKQVEGVFSAIC